MESVETSGVGLYKAVRVFKELDQIAEEQQHKLGLDHQHHFEDDNAILLPLEQVWTHDQLHYEGTHALDRTIHKVGLKQGQEVLDVGSGLGGPARYLAHKAGVRVVGVELQEDMCAAACKITSLTELRNSDHVRFVQGDFLHMGDESLTKYTTRGEGFDCVMSILTVLHIEAKADLFARCCRLLKPGGALYLEDYYEAGEMNQHTKQALEEQVGCAMPIPTKDRYLELLGQAGFVDVEFEDVTSSWWEFVRERANQYRANLDRHKRVQGDHDHVESLDAFYQTVAQLFDPSRRPGLGYCRSQ
ncbi:methyltransferase domain containing protein [Acanthamoeba castellanii str. Neff]|uniref:phosphoethanolamine N-methyltransferase n=1 Tax=Acanthamoeba castellanii (strain ATCC 30010 / Neff) TaxID=1257118 RepID=L8H2J8_ACACF|nr:methyltransferase domain containing protein [Acanthamoeba castellanii str. Neff]ELR19467.1 methyltransferase domain containing protein [Acanthamoeba castellanii str. Neff]